MLAFRIVGFGDLVSVFDPELIREIFSGDSETLRGGEVNARALGFLGPNSLVLLDGPRHLHTRRLLLPPFHGEAIAHHARLIEEIALEHVGHWPSWRNADICATRIGSTGLRIWDRLPPSPIPST